MLTLVQAVALIVWLRVRLGLAPLLDLEDAIAQRTTHNAQRTTHNAQRTTHNAQRTTHNAQRTTHNTQRSSEDPSPIQRKIPVEVRGIVGRFNAVLSELSGNMRTKDDFISNAANQLRNPIAGVLALAEAVVSAKTMEESRERGEDLLDASRHPARLTEICWHWNGRNPCDRATIRRR